MAGSARGQCLSTRHGWLSVRLGEEYEWASDQRGGLRMDRIDGLKLERGGHFESYDISGLPAPP